MPYLPSSWYTVSVITHGIIGYDQAIAILTLGILNPLSAFPPFIPPVSSSNLAPMAANFQVPTGSTEAKGIFPSDIIIRTAVVEGINELRRNPWLLDYCFAYLVQDALTNKIYGEKELQRAKDWFLKNQISVGMIPLMNEAKMPFISIKLVESSESEVTTGDTHAFPQETNQLLWQNLIGPLTPIGYDSSTGTITLSKELTGGLIIVDGMVVLTKTNNVYPILSVGADGLSFNIASNIIDDFQDFVIRGTQPTGVTTIESVFYKEIYTLGVHVAGEPVYLTWLHTILVFILLRYKQNFLEYRGFESSSFSSSAFDRDASAEAENYFSRYVTLTGKVRQYWPKDFTARVQAVQTNLDVISNSTEIPVAGNWETTVDTPDVPPPYPPPIPNPPIEPSNPPDQNQIPGQGPGWGWSA